MKTAFEKGYKDADVLAKLCAAVRQVLVPQVLVPQVLVPQDRALLLVPIG